MRLYELKSIYNFASENNTQNINRPKPSNLLNSDAIHRQQFRATALLPSTQKGFPAHT